MESCKHCGSINLCEKSRPPHIGIYCNRCGTLQKWIKQAKKNEVDGYASDAQQKYAIDLLKNWKVKNIPMTSRQAGAIIQVFKDY